MTTLLQVLASIGGTAGFGAGIKVLLSWLSAQARKEGKLDQILTDLTAITADHETRIRTLESAK